MLRERDRVLLKGRSIMKDAAVGAHEPGVPLRGVPIIGTVFEKSMICAKHIEMVARGDSAKRRLAAVQRYWKATSLDVLK